MTDKVPAVVLVGTRIRYTERRLTVRSISSLSAKAERLGLKAERPPLSDFPQKAVVMAAIPENSGLAALTAPVQADMVAFTMRVQILVVRAALVRMVSWPLALAILIMALAAEVAVRPLTAFTVQAAKLAAAQVTTETARRILVQEAQALALAAAA